MSSQDRVQTRESLMMKPLWKYVNLVNTAHFYWISGLPGARTVLNAQGWLEGAGAATFATVWAFGQRRWSLTAYLISHLPAAWLSSKIEQEETACGNPDQLTQADLNNSASLPHLQVSLAYSTPCSQPCTFWSKLLQEQILVRRNSPRLFL